MAQALLAGLAEAPARAPRPKAAEPVAVPVPEAAPEAAPEVEAAPAVVDAAPREAPVAVPALIVDRPLRSGQQVVARGRDVVVLGGVNAGAEVIADGHVHVYGPLRGRAIAGARGNTDARILTTCLEAELLAIAGTYRTAETPIAPEVAGRPAQVRLVDGKLVMEPLRT
jgi:septum site-determining protein MinC